MMRAPRRRAKPDRETTWGSPPEIVQQFEINTPCKAPRDDIAVEPL